MPLLDRNTLATLSNQQVYLDDVAYPAGYLDATLAAVDAQIASFLRYVPWLAMHSREEGPVQWLDSGPYAGRYLLTLRHRPLVLGPASAVFTDLRLTYALALTLPSVVNAADTVVEHSSGRVYTLAPGFVDALSGVGFQYGGSQRAIWAVGYRASYAAGFATGIEDPTPLGGGSYGAPALPDDLRYAAALLAQEMLTMQSQQNADPGQPVAGVVGSVKIGQRAWTYRPPAMSANGSGALGYGGPMAQQAAAILQRYKKSPSPALV